MIKKKGISFLLNILLLTLSTGLFLALFLFVGQYIPYGNSNITKIIVLKGWGLKNSVLGAARIGIFEKDPELGWKLMPNSRGKHYQPYGFDVEYTIDEEGHRITPGSYDLPKVFFLGGSFTFGHGIEDNENYVYKLGEIFPSYKMVNQAVMAWGTGHVYLQLQRSFEKYGAPKVVVYSFITSHLPRNYIRKDWLQLVESWGRQNPYFEMDNGDLVFMGLASSEKFGIPADDYCKSMEKKITQAFIRRMKERCERDSVLFLVAYLPDQASGDFKEEILEVLDSSQFVDLRDHILYEEYKLEGDAHPSPEGNMQIVTNMKSKLEKIFKKQIVLTEMDKTILKE